MARIPRTAKQRLSNKSFRAYSEYPTAREARWRLHRLRTGRAGHHSLSWRKPYCGTIKYGKSRASFSVCGCALQHRIALTSGRQVYEIGYLSAGAPVRTRPAMGFPNDKAATAAARRAVVSRFLRCEVIVRDGLLGSRSPCGLRWLRLVCLSRLATGPPSCPHVCIRRAHSG